VLQHLAVEFDLLLFFSHFRSPTIGEGRPA
jgi:hypothetical protein